MTTLSLIARSLHCRGSTESFSSAPHVEALTAPGQQKTSWPEAQEALANTKGRSPSGKEEDPEEPLVGHVTCDCGAQLPIRQPCRVRCPHARSEVRAPRRSRRPRDRRCDGGQGGSAGLDAHHEHLSEHEQVVSCLDHPFDTAVDEGHSAYKYRVPGRCRVPLDPIELVSLALGESRRDLGLVLAEHADAKRSRGVDERPAPRGLPTKKPTNGGRVRPGRRCPPTAPSGGRRQPRPRPRRSSARAPSPGGSALR